MKGVIEDDRDKRQQEQLEAIADLDGDGIPDALPEPKRTWLQKLFHKSPVKAKIQTWQEAQAEKVRKMLPKTDGSPKVYVENLADSAVQLKVRAWTRNSDYWDVFFEINERIYNELPQSGVNFPFPQMDVHLDGRLDSRVVRPEQQ